MDQVERLGVERDLDAGGEDSDHPRKSTARFRPLVADERRTQDPGIGGGADEGQVDPVDGGPREDQAGD